MSSCIAYARAALYPAQPTYQAQRGSRSSRQTPRLPPVLIRCCHASPASLHRRSFLSGLTAAPLFLATTPPQAQGITMGGGDGGKEPSFPYTHLWTSADGETHLKECKFHGFEMKKYAEAEQAQKQTDSPSKAVFTELPAGMEQPWHSGPNVQFVTCLSGSWYVKASDGTKRVFQPGEVLFQDNTKRTPAAKEPKHFSGVVGDQPCQQLIVQVDRPEEVDNPGPL